MWNFNRSRLTVKPTNWLIYLRINVCHDIVRSLTSYIHMTSSKFVNLTQKKLINNLTVQKYYQYTHMPTPANKMKLKMNQPPHHPPNQQTKKIICQVIWVISNSLFSRTLTIRFERFCFVYYLAIKMWMGMSLLSDLCL